MSQTDNLPFIAALTTAIDILEEHIQKKEVTGLEKALIDLKKARSQYKVSVDRKKIVVNQGSEAAIQENEAKEQENEAKEQETPVESDHPGDLENPNLNQTTLSDFTGPKNK